MKRKLKTFLFIAYMYVYLPQRGKLLCNKNKKKIFNSKKKVKGNKFQFCDVLAMYYYNSIVCIQIHTTATAAPRVLNETECVSGENERKIYGKSIFFTTATSAFFFFTL
ncbi:hypothetical protein ACKWTF_012472 [Chironomus riparius]